MRKNVFYIEELKIYFKQLKHICKEFGILTTNMQNINKTKFRIDCEKSRIVIIVKTILSTKLSSTIANLDNREYITLIKIVSINNETIALLIIFKKSSLLYRYFVVNNLHSYIILDFNNFVYINDNIFEN